MELGAGVNDANKIAIGASLVILVSFTPAGPIMGITVISIFVLYIVFNILRVFGLPGPSRRRHPGPGP